MRRWKVVKVSPTLAIYVILAIRLLFDCCFLEKSVKSVIKQSNHALDSTRFVESEAHYCLFTRTQLRALSLSWKARAKGCDNGISAGRRAIAGSETLTQVKGWVCAFLLCFIAFSLEAHARTGDH